MPAYNTSASKKATVTHESIIRDVRAGNIKPVYFLMGEESYYIDRLSDFLVAALLKPEERDFNLMTFFGADASVDNVIGTAKGFPMGAQRLVVVVREAQNMQGLDKLEYYLKQPQPTTVLIVCYKNGTLDRRKKVATLIDKAGVLYESKKLYDSQLPAFINDYLKRKKRRMEPEAVALMAEHVGADLNRMAGELDKLCLACAPEDRPIDVAAVERNIGISKDFSIFELQDALAQKDVFRVNRIANYFDKNPKQNPIQKTLPALFRFYSNLMLAYYAPQRTEKGIADWLGMAEWQVRRSIMPAMKRYSGVKVMQIISEIRRADGRSKGVGNVATSNGDIMKELLFFIMH